MYGPFASSKRLTQILPLNFVGAPKTAAPPKPKTYINPSGKAVLVSNNSPLWSNNVSATVSTVFKLMETCEPNSRSRVFVLVATIGPSTPSLLLLLPREFGRVTGYPPYSLVVSKATLALLNHSGPNLALPRLSYMTPSLVPWQTVSGATSHNRSTLGTVTSPLIRTWLRGPAPPGGGNSRSSYPTSLKLYVATVWGKPER